VSWGLAALSGLLGGLGGVPKGMAEGTAADQRQQQINLQGRQLDMQALAPILKASMDAEQKKAELARKAALGQDLSRQLLEQGTSVGMAPGASVEMPQPGHLLAPPAATPMPAMTQKTVDPKMAALAKYIPMLAQLDPAGTSKQVMEQFAAPKPQIVGENARGYLQGDKFTPFPETPETAIPPGMEPSSVTRRGVTYKPPGADKPERTLAERIAAGRAAFAADPSAENQARLTRLEEALRVETGLAGARAGSVAGAKLAVEPQELLSPDEAAALGVPYGTRKGQAQGRTSLTAGQRTKMDAQNAVLAMVDKMERDVTEIVKAPKTPAGRVAATPKAVYDVYGQGDPKLSALHRRLEGTLALIVRSLGEVGTLTDKDIARARSLQPVFAPVPDTEDVVKEKLRELRNLVQEVAARTGNRPENMGGTPTPPPPAAPPAQKRMKFNPATGMLE
jgi:hypothetical protein